MFTVFSTRRLTAVPQLHYLCLSSLNTLLFHACYMAETFLPPSYHSSSNIRRREQIIKKTAYQVILLISVTSSPSGQNILLSNEYIYIPRLSMSALYLEAVNICTSRYLISCELYVRSDHVTCQQIRDSWSRHMDSLVWRVIRSLVQRKFIKCNYHS